MVNELIKGVSIKLNATFGDGYEIYVKDVKQGLKEPCFFIAVLQPERRPMLGPRSFQTNPFDIHYFPEDETDNGEMIGVAERMMDALEMITLLNGDLIRGTNRKYEIVDGVLHFFVNFNMHLIKPVDATPMETLDVETGTVKG